MKFEKQIIKIMRSGIDYLYNTECDVCGKKRVCDPVSIGLGIIRVCKECNKNESR